MAADETQEVAFGRTPLPDEQRDALRRATRLEWVSLAVVTGTVALVMLVMGSSQAMKAAWIEDLLSYLPAIAFLVAARVARRRPDDAHPWGFHRAVGVGHLASALALFALGSYVVYDSAMTLLTREHPTIGTMQVLGQTVWQGYLMMAVLVVTAIPTMLLGRAKLKLAEPLHDKVLYADADMMRADWMTAGGAILGLALIGFGLWWADAAVALLIGADIVKDGVTNVRHAVVGLMDATARTHDDSGEHPLVDRVREVALTQRGVRDASVRMRDMGHLFHAEVFVVPRGRLEPDDLSVIRARLSELDWKLEDLTVVPVPELPRWSGKQ